MTDFFAQLAARHQGEARVLRPRVPFRFEPVSASLAAADLTGDAAAEPGWSGAALDRPFRRPGGPGRPGEPWRGPAAEDGDWPAAGPGSAPAMAGGPHSTGLRPIRPAGRPWDQMVDTEPDLSGTAHADGAVSGGTGQAGQDPAGAVVSAVAVLPEAAAAAAERAASRSAAAVDAAATSALDRAAVPESAEREVLPQRRAAAATAAPGAADQVARWVWRPGPGGDPDEADVAAGADAGRARRRSRLVPRPELPGQPGRPPSVAAPAPSRGRPSDQRRAQDRAADGPSGPGQESITVQVTIGRVEVRATPPAAPPGGRSAAAPRSAAGPSLADYLRHRSRTAGARP